MERKTVPVLHPAFLILHDALAKLTTAANMLAADPVLSCTEAARAADCIVSDLWHLVPVAGPEFEKRH